MAAQAAEPAPPAAAEKLPEGWFEAVDPTYNHPYWYNPSSGERTWERPKVRRDPARVNAAGGNEQCGVASVAKL